MEQDLGQQGTEFKWKAPSKSGSLREITHVQLKRGGELRGLNLDRTYANVVQAITAS